MKKFVKFLVTIALIPYVLFKELLKDSIRNEQLITALKNRYERFKSDASKFSDPQVIELLRRIKARKDVCEVCARTIITHNTMDPVSDFTWRVLDNPAYWEAAEKVVVEVMEQRSIIMTTEA